MTRPQQCSDQEVLEGIDLLHADIGARQRELLAHVAEWDRRERWKEDGCRDLAQWLSARLGISNWEARRWMAAAHALEGLPATAEALASGRRPMPF